LCVLKHTFGETSQYFNSLFVVPEVTKPELVVKTKEPARKVDEGKPAVVKKITPEAGRIDEGPRMKPPLCCSNNPPCVVVVVVGRFDLQFSCFSCCASDSLSSINLS